MTRDGWDLGGFYVQSSTSPRFFFLRVHALSVSVHRTPVWSVHLEIRSPRNSFTTFTVKFVHHVHHEIRFPCPPVVPCLPVSRVLSCPVVPCPSAEENRSGSCPSLIPRSCYWEGKKEFGVVEHHWAPPVRIVWGELILI